MLRQHFVRSPGIGLAGWDWGNHAIGTGAMEDLEVETGLADVKCCWVFERALISSSKGKLGIAL